MSLEFVDSPVPLRGHFVIWIENYDPAGPAGSFRLSPQGAKGYDGWAVSNGRYCARDNWKAIRKFLTWNAVADYLKTKTKKGHCPFEPQYVLESSSRIRSVIPVTCRVDAERIDAMESEREQKIKTIYIKKFPLLHIVKKYYPDSTIAVTLAVLADDIKRLGLIAAKSKFLEKQSKSKFYRLLQCLRHDQLAKELDLSLDQSVK